MPSHVTAAELESLKRLRVDLLEKMKPESNHTTLQQELFKIDHQTLLMEEKEKFAQ